MSLTIKRVLIFFSVSLNLGFIVFSVFAQFNDSGLRKPAQASIGAQALAQTQAQPSARQAAQKAITDFDQSVAGLHEKLRESRLRTISLLGRPGDLPLIELEQVRLTREKLLLERTALLHSHLLELRQILGPDASQVYFRELHERLRQRFESK